MDCNNPVSGGSPVHTGMQQDGADLHALVSLQGADHEGSQLANRFDRGTH